MARRSQLLMRFEQNEILGKDEASHRTRFARTRSRVGVGDAGQLELDLRQQLRGKDTTAIEW